MIKLPNTVKWIITDFDGVITDNYVYIDDELKMSRRLNFKDIIAFSQLRKNDINVAFISGEMNGAMRVLAEKFGIKEVHGQIRIKIDVLKSIIDKYNLTQEEYVFIGDDVNDIQCLEYAKYKITVPHAVDKVKSVSGIQITENESGDGAFREVADCLLG